MKLAEQLGKVLTNVVILLPPPPSLPSNIALPHKLCMPFALLLPLMHRVGSLRGTPGTLVPFGRLQQRC